MPQVDRAADPARLQVTGAQPVRGGVNRHGTEIELPGDAHTPQADLAIGGEAVVAEHATVDGDALGVQREPVTIG